MPTELRPQNVFMDRFDLEPKVQRVWGVPHATWFTLMGVGGGLFLLARSLGLTTSLGKVLGIPLGDLVSFAAIAVGGLVLIADLGRPWRFWRAFLNVSTSWISWGAICDAIFLLWEACLCYRSWSSGVSVRSPASHGPRRPKPEAGACWRWAPGWPPWS